MRSQLSLPNLSGSGMQTLVRAWFWCVLVEILGCLLHALIDGDGLSAASMPYQLICSLANLSPLWFSACMMLGISSEISPMHQSILGLCSMSHICPRITMVWLMLVTWNVTHSEWSLYWTIRSMTL